MKKKAWMDTMMIETIFAAFAKLRMFCGAPCFFALESMMKDQITDGIDRSNHKKNQLITDTTIAMIAWVRKLSNCADAGEVYIGWPYTG